MPRVKLAEPTGTEEIYEELFGQYGGMITRKQVGEYIGVKDPRAVVTFLAGVPEHHITGRLIRYRARDVAREIARTRA